MKTWNTPEIKELNWEETMAGFTQGGEETATNQICAADQANINVDGQNPYACGFTLES